MAIQQSDVADRFNDVGLTLPVGADQGGDPAIELDRDFCVTAKVIESKGTYVHSRTASLTTTRVALASGGNGMKGCPPEIRQ